MPFAAAMRAGFSVSSGLPGRQPELDATDKETFVQYVSLKQKESEAGPVLDPGEYGHIPTTGLTSGHQGCAGCGMVSGTNQVLRALKLTGRFVAASIGTGWKTAS